jgi:hypothetical protein
MTKTGQIAMTLVTTAGRSRTIELVAEQPAVIVRMPANPTCLEKKRMVCRENADGDMVCGLLLATIVRRAGASHDVFPEKP